jgi:eukaryotic-like serine/threonine-protein kinase
LTVSETQIGRYRIESLLGSGGMAVVYLGRDDLLDRPVAIKRLADNLAANDDFRERFLREGRLAAGLSHPNIVQVYDTGEDDNARPYIVMEFVAGESLAVTLQRERLLDSPRVIGIGLDACAGLGYAHAAGLVHRDVKPHNMLADPRGRIKIADFGVARSLDGASLTRTGSVIGTANYLAPEQARGEDVTTAADIYALGVTLYQLSTGHTPTASVEVVRELPQPLSGAIAQCLDPDPRRRPTAADLAAELTAAPTSAATHVMGDRAGSEPTRVLPEPPFRPAARSVHEGRRRWSPNQRLILAAIAALVVALIVIGLAARGGGGNGGGAPPASPRTTPTAVRGPAPGATPAEAAHNLATWIRNHSGG